MSTTLNLFISSKMKELAPEREALTALIDSLDYGDIKLHAWVFEQDAYASDDSIQSVYLKELQDSALYLGVFWNAYGEYTIDEFDHATTWNIERHIYVKDVDTEERDPRLKDFLEEHGDVRTGIASVWFKTTDELCEAVKRSIEQWFEDRLRARATSGDATLIEHADDVPHKPRRFFGREAQIEQIRAALADGEPVLLQGLAGEGKTALAAQVAFDWLAEGERKAIWLAAGSTPAEGLFEALGRPFGLSREIARETGDAQVAAVRQMLRASGASLLVIDDCWNGAALKRVLEAVPDGMAVMMTARQRYPVEGRLVPVEALPLPDALALLGHHAGFTSPPGPLFARREGEGARGEDRGGEGEGARDGEMTHAERLCETLGRLAFAVEIAGRNLKAHGWTPAELLARMGDAPHDLETPLEFREAGRESVARLLDASLRALPEEARNVFLAFGAFFATQMTPEMITRFFRGTPEVSDEMLTQARAEIKEVKDLPDDELHAMISQAISSQPVDPTPILAHLETLVLYGLAMRIPATPEAVEHYRIHDLTYSYVRSQLNDAARDRALAICLAYVQQFQQPSLTAFAALRPELDNLIGAAEYAFAAGRWADAEQFAWSLYAGQSEFLDYAGYPREAIRLLEQAAQAAERRGDTKARGAHIMHKGLALFGLGQYAGAIESYEQALAIDRAIGDRRGEGADLGNLGIAYKDLGEYARAIEYDEQALAIAREIGDRRGEGADLGNLGIAYKDLGEYARAIEYHEQALAIRRAIGDRRGEGADLGNLGIAYFSLGEYARAIEYYEQALVIQREIGDRLGEGNQTGNLGALYEAQGDLSRAVDYYRQARDIFAAIGAQHWVAKTDANIARVERK